MPALTNVFSKALKDGVSNVSFSTLSADLGQTMYEYSFRIPPYYTLLVRSLSVLEVRHFSTCLTVFLSTIDMTLVLNGNVTLIFQACMLM